jgi:hypothetical protein
VPVVAVTTRLNVSLASRLAAALLSLEFAARLARRRLLHRRTW